MTDWWLIARTPSESCVWQLGDPGPAVVDDLASRARALLDWPLGDGPAAGTGWDLSLAPGEPHPSLLAACRRREVSELTGLAAGRVQAWRAGDAAARHEVEVAAMHAAVAGMPAAQQEALRARLGWTPPNPSGTGGKA